MKIKKKLLISFSIIIVLTLAGLFCLFFNLYNNNKFDTLPKVSNKEAKQEAIEKYLLKEESDGYFRSSNSKFFCEVEVLWEFDLNDKEEIVYAPNNCQSVVLLGGDLRAESGGGRPPLFKIGYQNDKWKVIDADNRTVSLKQSITQDWVKEVENKTCFPRGSAARSHRGRCGNLWFLRQLRDESSQDISQCV